MKLSMNVVNVLKNFANINPSIIVSKGNILRTNSPLVTILAKAVVDCEFPRQFAIYDLARFNATLSLFDNPDITFYDNYLEVTSGGKKCRIIYADEENVIKPMESDPDIDQSYYCKFKISREELKEVEKALGVLALPEIVFSGADGKISIQATDTNNISKDKFSIVIGETTKPFNIIFKKENIRLLPDAYDVSICAAGENGSFGHFKSETSKVEYWVAAEATSSYK